MNTQRSSNHLSTIIIGLVIIIILFWMYSSAMSYRHSNTLAEESFLAVKENYIRIQVNRTIQMIENHMQTAPKIYGGQLELLAEALQSDDEALAAYRDGDLSLEEMVRDYLILNESINYQVVNGGSDIPQAVLQERVELGNDHALALFLTQEDLTDLVKTEVIPKVRDIRLEDNGYIWVNEVVDYSGGDNYAIRRIHANLQDTEGQYLTTGAQDAHGNFPYQIELDGINAKGEITFEYYFKKMGSETISRKMSYAKLYEPFDWIVATGVHLDDLEAYLIEEKRERTDNYRLQLLLMSVMLLALIVFFIWRMRLSVEVIRYQAKNNELTEELKVHAGELEEALLSLEAAEEELVENAKRTLTTQLVAGVAHEINTPLGISLTCTTHINDTLKNFRESFEKGQLSKTGFISQSDELTETAELLENNIRRSIKLMENFKGVAVDMTTDERRTFDLCTYMDEVTDGLARSMKKSNCRVEIVCEEKVEVNSYPGALYQVVTNLFMNSVHHGFTDREGGKIKVTVGKEDGKAVIVYEDDGKGIDKDKIGTVFEPFYTTGKSHGNSGLGLYIVKNLVESTLSGEIACEENALAGARFRVTFPIEKEE